MPSSPVGKPRNWWNPRIPQKKRSDFRVPVNLDLQGDQIRDMFGDDIRMQQIAAASESPLEGDAVETLSLAEFRKANALGQIKTADPVNPLRVLTTAGSRDAVIVGTREVVTNLVTPKDSSGKPLEADPIQRHGFDRRFSPTTSSNSSKPKPVTTAPPTI